MPNFLIIFPLGLVAWYLIQSFHVLFKQEQDSYKLSSYLFKRILLSIGIMVLLLLAGLLRIIPAKSSPFMMAPHQIQ